MLPHTGLSCYRKLHFKCESASIKAAPPERKPHATPNHSPYLLAACTDSNPNIHEPPAMTASPSQAPDQTEQPNGKTLLR